MNSIKVEVGGKIVEIPEDYDPRNSNDEYMCEKHRAFFKLKLLNWLEEVKRKLSAENINDVNSDRRSTDESDQISMEVNALTELRSKDRLRKLAKKIEENINKIDEDIYGFCEESGNEIGINRLILRPIARYCVEIQEKKDREEAEKEYIEYNQDDRKIKRDSEEVFEKIENDD